MFLTTRTINLYGEKLRARFVARPKNARVIVSLERHSIKTAKKRNKTGLTLQGIALARKKGKRLPKLDLKGYSSPLVRAVSTLKYSQAAAGKSSLKYPALRKRKEIGLDYLHDAKAWKLIVEKKGEIRGVRDWLDGKLPISVVGSPAEVANAIIKKRFALGKIVTELGGKGILIRNVSHVPNVEVVFERLTGRKFESTSKKPMLARPTEGLRVSFSRDGKAVLSYRGKHYDVTKSLNEIVGEERVKHIALLSRKLL